MNSPKIKSSGNQDAAIALSKGIKQLAFGADGYVPVRLMDVNVVSVNEAERTCIVDSVDGSKDIDGLEVRLVPEVSDGDYDVPTIGTTISIIFNPFTPPIMFSKTWLDKKQIIVGDQGVKFIDGKTTFNDGAFGGLIKIEELKTELGKVNSILNAILNILSGAPINEPGNGSPSALQAALGIAVAGLQTPDYSDIENENIIHGENIPD